MFVSGMFFFVPYICRSFSFFHTFVMFKEWPLETVNGKGGLVNCLHFLYLDVNVRSYEYTLFHDKNCYQNDIGNLGATTSESCISACDTDTQCNAVVYWPKHSWCYKKSICYQSNMQYTEGMEVYIRKGNF